MCDVMDVAGVPLAALTAYQALFEDLHVEAGQRVVIIGASGGVGTFAVQLAVAKGKPNPIRLYHLVALCRSLIYGALSACLLYHIF